MFRERLATLFQAAPEEIRKGLGIFSGYRDAAYQAKLYHDAPNKHMVARPGHSEHGVGMAADVAWHGESLAHAPEHVVQWLHRNAEKFGLKFPLNGKGGMPLENWHIEPVETRGGKPFQQT